MWKKRRIKKNRFGALIVIASVVFIIFAIVFLFLLFFRIGLFTIKIVRIESNGLGCVSEKQLEDTAGLLGRNYFFINSAKVEESLKRNFFCIKSVILSKQLPDKILLQISGRQSIATLVDLKYKQASFSSLIENTATPVASQPENLYIIDNEGVVFDKGKDVLDIPKVYVYDMNISLGKSLTDGLIVNCLRILDKVKVFGIKVKEGWIDSNFFIITGDPKPKIIFGLEENEKIDIQLASLQLILTEAKINSRELEFIDLRFDKPIVRLAPKK